METGYKNIVGSRKKCSYNRYVLIRGKINLGAYRNVSSENVLITGMSYIRFLLYVHMRLSKISYSKITKDTENIISVLCVLGDLRI